MSDYRRELIRHEAGHGAASLALDVPVELISLMRNSYSNGRVRLRAIDGGKYTISLYGFGVDLNAVGQPAAGKIWLQGSATLVSDGKYSIDGADFHSLPDVGAWLSMGG